MQAMWGRIPYYGNESDHVRTSVPPDHLLRTKKEKSMNQIAAESITSDHQPMIAVAVDRLDNIATEAEAILERLRSTYASVTYHGPSATPSEGKPDHGSGSDLGQALMRSADRIGESLHAIKEVLNASDI